MKTARPNHLAILPPHTLGGSHGIKSALQASLAPSGNHWRVEWLDSTGNPISAEAHIGGSVWSKPARGLTVPAKASDHDVPAGLLTCAALTFGRAGLRSGRRLVGTPPCFPSAGLVLCHEDAGTWQDVAFADEAPDQEIGSVALAIAPGHWLAAYLVIDKTGCSMCRVVQHSLTPAAAAPVNWRGLPPYPQSPGMAGMMVGQHNGVIIAAGGANFPDLRPWEGGKKRIYDEIYVLLPGRTTWQAAGRLPRPRGYGATVSLPQGVLIAGGEDGLEVFADTLVLRWTGVGIDISFGPPLPAPTTCAVADVLNNAVYLSGGYCHGTPRISQKFFWRLNWAVSEPKWETLPSWPGPTRALAVTAALDGAIYLISGIEVGANEGTETPGVYLKDAYRYKPEVGWVKLPDLPWSSLAGASPAPVTENPPRVFVLGGVDGRQVGKLPRDIALPDDIIYLDLLRNEWRHWPERWPTPVVCLSAVRLGEDWIFSSGELMAGVRTTEVWAWQIKG